jgi:RNA polymerase sigma-70 factor (ECF subfamily)
MADTTADLNNLLARFHAGDSAAKREIVERAYNRLRILARGILRDFPAVRREEETAAIVHLAYQRLERAMDDLYAPSACPAGQPAEPPDAAAFFGLAARNIRWQLQDLARAGKRGKEPRPDEVPINPADGAGIDPADPGTDLSDVGRTVDVLEAIERLSTEHRTVCDLIFVQGLTIEEAAQVAGISYDQMKHRWTAAKAELGGLLRSYKPPAE